MSTTPPPVPDGLGPLDREPRSVHPPYTQRPTRYPNRDECYRALLAALGDLELGSYDVRILGWFAGWGPGPVAVVCSLLSRARAAGHHDSDHDALGEQP